MTKLKVLRLTATVATSMGLIGSFAGVAGASSGIITNTGQGSSNHVNFDNSLVMHVTNKNTVGLSNKNPQTSKTGKAVVVDNTTGGDATSGDAANNGTLNVDGTIDNSGSSGGSSSVSMPSDSATISTTGQGSSNTVKVDNDVTSTVNNTNTVKISNTNTQSATSGKAVVAGNTTGGDATSGGATNTSNTTVDFTITN